MIFKLAKNQLVKTISYGRFALYSLESLPIINVRKKMGLMEPPNPAPPENHFESLIQSTSDMISQDLANLEQGIYPLSLLTPENPVAHLKRYYKIYRDSLNVAQRFKDKKHREFSEDSQHLAEDLPDYFTRNFHNQTDGYLSDESAQLYTHQIEILFKGSMGLMRRTLLSDLIKYVKGQNRTLKVLELGSGSGDSSEILLESCNNIELTAIDLSQPYLSKAKDRLSNYDNIKIEFAAAETFNSDEQYDIIFSSYLFHEVPLKVRQDIFENTFRLLKPGGKMFHMDSLQLGDREDFNWALLQFPKDFHEPFYKAYTNNLLEDVEIPGLVVGDSKQSFLSKSVWFTKEFCSWPNSK